MTAADKVMLRLSYNLTDGKTIDQFEPFMANQATILMLHRWLLTCCRQIENFEANAQNNDIARILGMPLNTAWTSQPVPVTKYIRSQAKHASEWLASSVDYQNTNGLADIPVDAFRILEIIRQRLGNKGGQGILPLMITELARSVNSD